MHPRLTASALALVAGFGGSVVSAEAAAFVDGNATLGGDDTGWGDVRSGRGGALETRATGGKTHVLASAGLISASVLFGDCDADGDVDLDDWVVFQAALTGPIFGLGPEFECADADADTDVDLVDATVFAWSFTGSSHRSGGRTIPSYASFTVLAGGASEITVAPQTEVVYEILAELSNNENEGLAFVGVDLSFTGGDLEPADSPTGGAMASFVAPEGVNNPAGYGGTAIDGDLVQVGGGQNAINNTPDNAPFPIGPVITGVGWPGSAQVVVTGALTAPNAHGTYTLALSNAFASVIRKGETGEPPQSFWRTEAASVGAVTDLTIVVSGVGILYVDDDAPLGGDGATWPTAYKYLQDALAVANAGAEIRVAQGTYKPDQDETGNVTPGERTETFQLISGVELYGGYRGCFEGTCGGEPDERNVEVFETKLTGDLNGDDIEDIAGFFACLSGDGKPYEPECEAFDVDGDGDTDADDGSLDENSHHVVTGGGVEVTAVLDGFTVTAGNADAAYPDGQGGGVYNVGGSPTLMDCTLTGNLAGMRGGGMANVFYSSPMLINCTITTNSSYLGGGLCNWDYCSPTLAYCTFSGNLAEQGGAMSNQGSDPILEGCTFSGNSAAEAGAVYNFDSNTVLVDCDFLGNTATIDGGGFHNTFSTAVLIRCTFSDNLAFYYAGGMYTLGGNPELWDCTFQGNTADFGGAIFTQSIGGPLLVGCTFIGNSAVAGGGLYDEMGTPWLVDCIFQGNVAEQLGGGMMTMPGSPLLTGCVFSGNSVHSGGRGGGLACGDASPLLTNCLFTGNSADQGGGLYNWASSPQVTNCTFSDNSALEGGGSGISNYENSSPVLANCILWDGEGEIRNNDSSTVTINHSNVQGGWAGEGNIDEAPLFADLDGPDDIPGTPDDNLRLLPGSPCIDAADNAAVPADVADLDNDGDTTERTPLDLDGAPRFVDDPHTEDSGAPDPPEYLDVVDMGAYEYQAPCSQDADCDDGNDCTSDVCEEGGCTHLNSFLGTACGDPSDTDCDHPDTCDGLGMCQANFEADGVPCPDSLYCNGEETCDGAGACQPGAPVLCPQIECGDTCNEEQQTCHTTAGVPCGDPTDSDCGNSDTCDGMGGCLENNEPDGLACPDDGDRCTNDFCVDKACTHPRWPDDHDNACGACCYATAGKCFDDLLEEECRGDVWAVNDSCADRDITCEKVSIPTVSQWGLVVLSLLLSIGIATKFARRRAPKA